ncbi:DMT family transporter [Pseudomonas sp. RIT-PI-S]|uniref:DMT family transporter n=1 Tax=Pseudomonas sp. RIT-PI-S TaxID=3035295 RepID=UPI0021D962A8|nr:DMT family transporter [Pseudomonas sp. RIT-PI-S]
MQRQALRADLLMLLTAMIWGSGFIAQTTGMKHIGPFLYSGLRFALGSACLLPLLYWRGRQLSRSVAQPRGQWAAGAAMGLALALGINLQQFGLQFTTVTNAGFITGLYVIVVPAVSLLLGQATGAGTWLGACLAVAGMYLLSVNEHFEVAAGDWLQLVGAFVWAGHVLLVGYFASRYDVIRLAFIQFAVCALASLALALLFEPLDGQAILAAAPAVAYGGMVAAALGYTLQVIAQRHAITSHAAIIFSLEAVFAAIAATLCLGEVLSPRGYLGCAVMLAGMLVAQLWPSRSHPVAA